ncbi:MAG: hypothetical protein R3F56_16735 [Planctomycetota bacterium]
MLASVTPRAVFVSCLALLGAAPLAAQEPAPRNEPPSLRLPPPRPAAGRLGLRTERWIAADGTVRTEVKATFSPLEYPAYKQALGDPVEILRRLLPASPTAIETAPARAAFDDDTDSLVLERTEVGDVQADRDGSRSYRVEAGLTFVEVRGSGGRPAVAFSETGVLFGMPFDGKQTVFVPQLALATTFDQQTRSVRWKPVRVATGTAPAKMSFEVKPAERVLSGAYKAYGFAGPHWVGQVVVRNAGPGRATNVRIRHRVGGYSEWSSWAKLSDVASGETLVHCLHPVLAPATAQLKSDTPADLLVEWTWVDGDGKERADADGVRLTLLGGNEFLFSRSHTGATAFADQYDNTALLAAWVSRDDPVVREVAALGAKRAGGAAANDGIFNAIATLKGLYETMVANDVTYQHPPALADTTLSFDNANVQNVKYPRDVLRDRSGTCIDLAILYASLLHATGLPAFLCIVPGHCFPVAGLPDGALAAVEVTGVGGGGRMGVDAATFGDVFLYGQIELEKALKGPHVLVDLRHQWTHGVSCPELPPVGPDFVAKRPFREKIDPAKQKHLVELRAEAVRDFAGEHARAFKDAAGATSNVRFKIAAAVDAKTFLIEARADGVLPVENGSAVEVEVTQVFEGRPLMNFMKGIGLRKVARVKATGTYVVLPPDRLELAVWDRGLEGSLVLADSGDPPVKLEIVPPKD